MTIGSTAIPTWRRRSGSFSRPVLPDSVLETFPQRWPSALAVLAGPSVSAPLCSTELRAIAAQDPGVRTLLSAGSRPTLSDTLLNRLPDLFQSSFNPAFARICPCSFKQGIWPEPPLTAVDQLIRRLQHPGERAAMMIYRCLHGDCRVFLTLKPWYDFTPGQEFRLFFYNRCLVGASQYHPGAVMASRQSQLVDLAARIVAFAERIANALHISNVVADIVMFDPLERMPLLLELNPWHPFTGAGFFDWSQPDTFDSTLRVRTFRHRVVAIPLPGWRA